MDAHSNTGFVSGIHSFYRLDGGYRRVSRFRSLELVWFRCKNPINAFVATRREAFRDNRRITFRGFSSICFVGDLCFGGEDRNDVDVLVAMVLFVVVRDRSSIVDGTVFSTSSSLFLFLLVEVDRGELRFCPSLSPSSPLTSPPFPSALLRLLIVPVFEAVSPGSKKLTVWRWRLERFPRSKMPSSWFKGGGLNEASSSMHLLFVVLPVFTVGTFFAEETPLWSPSVTTERGFAMWILFRVLINTSSSLMRLQTPRLLNFRKRPGGSKHLMESIMPITIPLFLRASFTFEEHLVYSFFLKDKIF
jgi:hypothetical protein